MTRNNLNEHLSWLLNSKPSVPTSATSLPPVTAPFSSINASQAVVPREDLHEPASTGDEETLPLDTDVNNSEEMARVRTAPGSANTSAPKGKVKGTPMKVLSYEAHSAKSPTMWKLHNTAVKPVAKPEDRHETSGCIGQGSLNPHDKIEIMDLTEGHAPANSTPSRRVVPSGSCRKRKSEEMDTKILSSRTSPRQSAQWAYPAAESYTVIDESVEEEEDVQSKSKTDPNEPPPPYSTHPFETRTASQQSGKPFLNAMDGKNSVEYDLMQQEDDDIMNFADPPSHLRRQPTGHKMAMTEPGPPGQTPRPTTTDYMPPHALYSHERGGLESDDITSSDLPAQSGLDEVPQEDSALLKSLLSSSEPAIKQAIDTLNHQRDSVCFELTEGLDQDLDVQHLEKRLDELDARVDAFTSLWNKRALYRTLSDEKDRLKDALLQAVRARHGVDAAKIANLAGKEKLQKLEGECSALLHTCRADIALLVNHSASSEEAKARRNIAVESTQPLVRSYDQLSSAPSSSRIIQTQYQTLMPPPPLPRPTKSAIAQSAQPRSHKSRTHNDIDDDLDIDDFATHDDSLDGSDPSLIHSRRPKISSNRMRTPPTQLNDDEEFGLDDDEDMFEWAQDLENTSMHPASQSVRRPPLAETSGNSQARYHATAVKGGRSRNERLDDLERRHFIHSWSDDVKSTLKQRFKLKGFRQGQVEAINATLGGKDVFVLMPTGGGKSLCYQLPSLITSGKTRGVTIVVSPLMSLMEDQVRHLSALSIQAFLFNSETSREERATLLSGLQDPNVEKFIQVLYVTPELLSANQRMISALDRLHQNKRMARLVIDEAHCVSQWGHDFRPDYKALGEVRRRYPNVPVMALTATATENVKVDTIHHLGIDGCEIFSRSFNRPNLYYEIRAKGKGKEDIESIATLIKEKYHRLCGIIYCFSRKNCEDVALALRTTHRIKAHHYHAGMEAAEKSRTQQEWQVGNVHVIVATIAFGMGIDKPNVRFVIHHSLPKSLEGYYQETGRAGRDGKRSDCYLYFGYQDASKLRRMIDDDEAPWEQKERQRQMLRKMVQFCDNESDCRRVQILAYFNERFRQDDCKGLCNNCNSESTFEEQDFTRYAQRAINLVRHLQSEKVTILHCIEVYRGADTKKIRDAGHDSLDDHGAGKKLDKGDVVRLFYRLISEGAIREIQWLNKAKFPQQSVQLGENCNAFDPGKERLTMQVRSSGSTGLPKAATKQQKRSRDAGNGTRGHSDRSGASSASRGLPASTNVSSPVQPLRRKVDPLRPAKCMQASTKSTIRNQFIVSDSDDEDGEYRDAQTESEDEAFEPVPQTMRPKHRRAAPELGPPITSDSFLDGLDDIHRFIVEQFVEKASDLGKSIMTKKNLHMVPFSDTILRVMAVRFTQTEEAMLAIPGIDPLRVQAHGKHFAKLVKQSYRQYEELMATEDRTNDKHAQNVIDLVSDEEENIDDVKGEEEEEDDDNNDNDDDHDDDDEFGSLGDDLEDEFEGLGSSSSYFPQQDRDVAAFNAKFMNSQSAGMRTIAASQPAKAAKPKRKARYSAKSRHASGSGQSYSRRNPSGEFDKFRCDTGSVNKKKGSERTGGKSHSNTSSRAAPRSTPKTTKKASGLSIPVMPT